MLSLITLKRSLLSCFGWKVHFEVCLQTCVSFELIDLITTLEDFLGRTCVCVPMHVRTYACRVCVQCVVMCVYVCRVCAYVVCGDVCVCVYVRMQNMCTVCGDVCVCMQSMETFCYMRTYMRILPHSLYVRMYVHMICM